VSPNLFLAQTVLPLLHVDDVFSFNFALLPHFFSPFDWAGLRVQIQCRLLSVSIQSSSRLPVLRSDPDSALPIRQLPSGLASLASINTLNSSLIDSRCLGQCQPALDDQSVRVVIHAYLLTSNDLVNSDVV